MLHFRMRVPIPLQGVLRRRVIKRSLGTRDLRAAQGAAYTLAGRYLALFDQARRQLGMSEVPTTTRLLPEDDPSSPLFIPPYRVERTQHGYALETNGSLADHEQGLEALREMMAAPLPAAPASAVVAPQGTEKRSGIALGEAVQKYLLTLDASLLPDKTRSQKRAAIWSEHPFIHLAILQGTLSTGEAVRELATADWGAKFRAAFGLGDELCKGHYYFLVDLRKQMRNFLAHGSFGKRGEAFHFHSAVGAVPLLINQRDGHPFQLSGDVPFAESKALAGIDAFLKWLWGSSLAPAKQYLDSELPTILTYSANGIYARVMQSDEAMCEFLDLTQAQWDRAGDMDF